MLLEELKEKTMKGAIVLATVLAVVGLGACRKEVAHEPMKLGADAAVKEQVAR
jgi:PII-like signaling protein